MILNYGIALSLSYYNSYAYTLDTSDVASRASGAANRIHYCHCFKGQ